MYDRKRNKSPKRIAWRKSRRELDNRRTKKHRNEAREYTNRAKSKPCMDCSKQYNPWIMNFDHLPQFSKSLDISAMVQQGYSFKVIQQEIDKCDVVCSNCHAERTHKRRQEKSLVSKR